jgi:hypothetical protein
VVEDRKKQLVAACVNGRRLPPHLRDAGPA